MLFLSLNLIFLCGCTCNVLHTSQKYLACCLHSIQKIEEHVSKNSVMFLNYCNEERFQKTEDFKDPRHLNDTETRVYSKTISSNL